MNQKCKSIGICPICKKGKMIHGMAGWVCDYFHSLEDKCSFSIFKKYYGYELSEKDAKDLILKGSTEPKEFFSQNGKSWLGSLKIINDKIKICQIEEELSLPCPVCNDKILRNNGMTFCRKYLETGTLHCNFHFSNNIAGRNISLQEIVSLLENGETEILDGFINKNKTYSSILRIEDNGVVVLDGRICKCPKCGGVIYAGEKCYSCSNFNNTKIACDFIIWRTIGKRYITVKDVRMLCSQHKTGNMTFFTKDNESYIKCLYLDENFRIKMK